MQLVATAQLLHPLAALVCLAYIKPFGFNILSRIPLFLPQVAASFGSRTKKNWNLATVYKTPCAGAPSMLSPRSRDGAPGERTCQTVTRHTMRPLHK
jgi:hypothetical protein